MMRKIFVVTGFFGLLATKAGAQNMNSPYSVYGIGDIQNSISDRSSGMANASMSLLATPGFLLHKNPASLIGLERSLGQVDLSLVGKTVTFNGTPISGSNNTAKDMTIKTFALSAKLNNHWASSFGFMPFSYVNYQFNNTKFVEGPSPSLTALVEGNGGLNRVYWNNAFAVGKHLALGLRSNFIFGSINQTETIYANNFSVPIVTRVQNYYNNFRFETGAIYHGNLGKNWKLGLGGKFTTKTDLRNQQTLTASESGSLIKNEVTTGTSYTVPMSYDAGISLTNKGRKTFAVDYSYQDWGGKNVDGTNYTYIPAQRLSAGFQMSNQVQKWGLVAEKSFIQAGVFAGQSYLQVKGEPINEFGVTAGYGGYLSRGLSYGFSLEAGRRGTTNKSLIRENYVQIGLVISYREVLYSKGRKYD